MTSSLPESSWLLQVFNYKLMDKIIILFTILSLISSTPDIKANPAVQRDKQPLAVVQYSLENRYAVESVNEVFKDNILLTLHLLKTNGTVSKPISWSEIDKAGFESSFTLKPAEVFAFHDDLLPEYKDKEVITTNAHFISKEGFKSDGYLFGDGVCHLASFIKVAAEKSGLIVKAPTRHDFAKIPDIDMEDGVSIFSRIGASGQYALQNLYVTNTKDKSVSFNFYFDGKTLTISVSEISSSV